MIGAVKASRQRIAQDEIMLQVLPEWLICGLDISAPGLQTVQTVRLPTEACERLSGKKREKCKKKIVSFDCFVMLAIVSSTGSNCSGFSSWS